MIAKLIVLVNSILTMTVNTCPTGNMPSLRSCVRSSRGPPRNEVAVDGTYCSIDVIGAVVDVIIDVTVAVTIVVNAAVVAISVVYAFFIGRCLSG